MLILDEVKWMNFTQVVIGWWVLKEMDMVKFGYSEKATKFEEIFHLKFDATQ